MTLDEAARGLKKKAIQNHGGNFLYFLRTNDHSARLVGEKSEKRKLPTLADLRKA